jgi:hypothetical protein
MSQKTNMPSNLESWAGPLVAKYRRQQKDVQQWQTVVLVEGRECASIQLTRGKFAIVDMDDFDLVRNVLWYAEPGADGTFYAARRDCLQQGRPKIYMHRLILDGPCTDHRNGNGLDNRRSNLRSATDLQNKTNRKPSSNTGRKGVCLNRHGRFVVTIKSDGRSKYLGTFSTVEEAAQCYNKAAVALWGEFAYLNPIHTQTNQINGTQC